MIDDKKRRKIKREISRLVADSNSVIKEIKKKEADIEELRDVHRDIVNQIASFQTMLYSK